MRLNKKIYQSEYVGERLLAGYSHRKLLKESNLSEVLYHCSKSRTSALYLIPKTSQIVNYSFDCGIVSLKLKDLGYRFQTKIYHDLQELVLKRYNIDNEGKGDFFLCLDLDSVCILNEVSEFDFLEKNLLKYSQGLVGVTNCLSLKNFTNLDYQNINLPNLNDYLSFFKSKGYSVQVYYPYPNHVYSFEIFSDFFPVRDSKIFNFNLGLEDKVLDIIDGNILVDKLFDMGISNELNSSFYFILKKL